MRVAHTRWLRRLAAAALLLASFVSSAAAQTSTTRRAATLAEYRGRVGEAVAPIEELVSGYERARESEKPEVWSQEGFSSDFIVVLPKKREETFTKVRGLLPQREKVERVGGEEVEVDNTWVHEALGGLKVGNYEKVAAGLRVLAGRLRALEAQLRASEATTAAEVDGDAERGRLNSILRRPEFDRGAPKQRGALERMIEDFIKWLASFIPKGTGISPGGSPRISQLTLWVVIVLCVAALAYVAFRLWRRRGEGIKSLRLKRGPRVVLGERLEADQTASDLLDEAERLARSGEPRGAIRKAYVALLCELGDRGVLRLAQHKTNRDYLNAVRRAADPRLYTEMLPLTSDFELHWYGLRAASDADWQSFKSRCRKAIKETGVRSQESE